ncbi:MBL fold metallo-hydrolase [Fluviicola sp.]|uniref:MBL fold metallo-hydrolase n=1 Tax=Fluviicola sp. TaxID=1917219 RepID=UPI003D29E409
MCKSNTLKFVILNFSLTLFLTIGYGQTNAITIKFIGNCGLYLTDGTSNIYVDFPYKSGAHHYMEYDRSEIDSVKNHAVFIFTHRHADHYSKRLLKKLDGQKFGPWNIDELEKLGESIPDFEIRAFKTQHKVFGISFKHDSYLITWHGKRIYLSGDTENADTLATQKDLDWAFVPVWLLMDAMEKKINLGGIAKMFAVYHIGPRDQITNDGADPKIKLLNKQGERIAISY